MTHPVSESRVPESRSETDFKLPPPWVARCLHAPGQAVSSADPATTPEPQPAQARGPLGDNDRGGRPIRAPTTAAAATAAAAGCDAWPPPPPPLTAAYPRRAGEEVCRAAPVSNDEVRRLPEYRRLTLSPKF